MPGSIAESRRVVRQIEALRSVWRSFSMGPTLNMWSTRVTAPATTGSYHATAKGREHISGGGMGMWQRQESVLDLPKGAYDVASGLVDLVIPRGFASSRRAPHTSDSPSMIVHTWSRLWKIDMSCRTVYHCVSSQPSADHLAHLYEVLTFAEMKIKQTSRSRLILPHKKARAGCGAKKRRAVRDPLRKHYPCIRC